MNYIKHTVAAHERLHQQPEARPQHISLYWALFFAWNAEYFGNGFDLDHDTLMAAVRIGNRKTYRATLYDLETWALLTYHPSKFRHSASRCELTGLSGAVVPPINQSIGGTTAPSKTELPGAEMPPINHSIGSRSAPDNRFYRGQKCPNTPYSTNSSNANSGNANSADATEKKRKEVFAGEGLSRAEVIDDTAEPNGPVPGDPYGAGAAPKMPRIKRDAAPKKKGVQTGTIRAAATAQATSAAATAGTTRGNRQKRPETTFQESAIYPKAAFSAAFEGTDYALADLNHYHEAVNLWRDKTTGEPPRRADWVATAKRFMFNDATDNRLKIAPNVQRHDGSPGSSTANPGIPSTGYRSSRWDS